MQRCSFLIGAGAALTLGSPTTTAASPTARFLDPENGRWGAELTASDTRGVVAALSPQALEGTVLGVDAAASRYRVRDPARTRAGTPVVDTGSLDLAAR